MHCVSCLCAAREQELITCLLAICIKVLHTVNVDYFEFRSSIFHQHFACTQVLRGVDCPCCLGVKVGLHARRLLCVLEVKQKNEKKTKQNISKNKIIHVIWPWRRIKKNNSKRNIQCQSPRARQTWRLWNMQFKVRTLKLQFQAQKLGNYNFIYIYF